MGILKHGEAPNLKSNGTRLYGIWVGMKTRCNNPKRKDYSYYGGKGIRVCEEWTNSYLLFKDWALSNGYAEDLTLDRIQSDKDYSPDNCRWVNRQEQSRNLASNVRLTLYGITKTMNEWSELCGLDRHTIHNRLDRGWSVEKTLTTVPHNSKKERREMTAKKIQAVLEGGGQWDK